MTNTYRGSPAPDDRNEQTDVLAALDVLPADRKLLQGRQGMIAGYDFGRARVLPRQRPLLADGAPVALGVRAADRAKLLTTDQTEGTAMITSGETEPALDHMSVPRHSPRQSRWGAQDAALEFGRFRMLVRRRQLTADGIPVRLGTRAFDLLTVLLEANGSLVAQEELLSRVWPGIHVSEENLKVQISALRKALGKDRDFIRTEVGRGYHFTAVVKSTTPCNTFPYGARRRPPGRRPVSRWMSMVLSFPRCFHADADLSTVSKSRLFKALALTTVLGLNTVALAAQAAPAGGSGTVQGLSDALPSTMKSGGMLGESGPFRETGAGHPQQLRPGFTRGYRNLLGSEHNPHQLICCELGQPAPERGVA
ncbi:MAG: winged helix-turn-helix domain-containing protein [Alphaproteobacteria bacterium]|nr:winged helix-turn-helix domain-containing protein [Alphaproteobacteria bacterium]